MNIQIFNLEQKNQEFQIRYHLNFKKVFSVKFKFF